eukprot:Opistho-2@56503
MAAVFRRRLRAIERRVGPSCVVGVQQHVPPRLKPLPVTVCLPDFNVKLRCARQSANHHRQMDRLNVRCAMCAPVTIFAYAVHCVARLPFQFFFIDIDHLRVFTLHANALILYVTFF